MTDQVVNLPGTGLGVEPSADVLRRGYIPETLERDGPFREHHPVFAAFEPWSGMPPERCWVDYVGSFISHDFSEAAVGAMRETVTAEIPPVDEEYFEWVDVLMSVLDAGARYRCLELGAGFGRWGVRAGLAARRRGVADVALDFYEAEPKHVEWLRAHAANNGFGADAARVHPVAVADADGRTMFYVGMPNDFDEATASKWYGQAMAHSYEAADDAGGSVVETYCGMPVVSFRSGFIAVEVEQRDIAAILAEHGEIDLIDMDVQGAELGIVTRGIEAMNRQVRRLHIGTHGPELEAGLREILSAHGWRAVRDFPSQKTVATPYGEVSFGDGVQSWLNPRFALTWG